MRMKRSDVEFGRRLLRKNYIPIASVRAFTVYDVSMTNKKKVIVRMKQGGPLVLTGEI